MFTNFFLDLGLNTRIIIQLRRNQKMKWNLFNFPKACIYVVQSLINYLFNQSYRNPKLLIWTPVGKITKKQSEGVRFLALQIQCQIVKNTLLQTAFSAILPTGYLLLYWIISQWCLSNKENIKFIYLFPHGNCFIEIKLNE